MKNIRLFIGLLFILSTVFVACTEEDTTYQFSLGDEYPISTYIGMQPEYSLWKDVMIKADLYTSFNVAGAYTVLVPDNESLVKFFEKKPFSDWTAEECHELVCNHSLPFELLRASIREGALTERTLNEKYISTEFEQSDGAQVVILNKSAVLKGLPYEALNGYVYGINGVLENLSEGVVGILERHGDCSIFLRALEETGIKSQLSIRDTTLWNGDVVKLEWTVFAVADSIYEESGITTYEKLKDHYTRNDAADIKDKLTNTTNGLFLHISKHIVDEEVYTNFLLTLPFGSETVEYNNWSITVSHYACFGNTNCLQSGAIDGKLAINPNVDKTDYTEVFADKSNFTSTNGCVHYVNRAVDGVEDVYREIINTVFHDVRLTDSIEDYGQDKGGWFSFNTRTPIKHGVIAEWKWHTEPEQIDIQYLYQNVDYLSNGGFLGLNLNYVNSGWIEYQTCPIPAGVYDGTITGHPDGGMHAYMNMSNDGMGVWNIILDGELTGNVWRTYPLPGMYGVNFDPGHIVFKRGGRHTIRFEFVSGNGFFQMGNMKFIP